jgi:hypothetical protein
MTYDLDHWMIAWTPMRIAKWEQQRGLVPGAVEVGPWPDRTGWSGHERYASTAGCCFVDRWPKLTREQKLDELIRGFMLLVLGDGLDPQAVHREFSKIEGYLDYDGQLGLGMGKHIWFQKGKMDPYNP